jgi:5-bromo-4-chloroindolyl phosphate hydrolysis protein
MIIGDHEIVRCVLERGIFRAEAGRFNKIENFGFSVIDAVGANVEKYAFMDIGKLHTGLMDAVFQNMLPVIRTLEIAYCRAHLSMLALFRAV